MNRLVFAMAMVGFAFSQSAYALQAPDGDWPRWRGPSGNGVAPAGQDVPFSWSDTENVIWDQPVFGRGHSSPTVVGDRIFMATADERNQIQYVIAHDRKTGSEVWRKEVSRGGFPNTHPKNTHATCTIACHDDLMFVAFHHHDKVTLACLDFDGQQQWKEDVAKYAPRLYEYGYAPSPVFYGSNVIVAGDYEGGGFIAAYDRKTGKRAWKKSRPKLLSFSAPVIANVAGSDQLLLSGCNLVSSYDPETGKKKWSARGTTMATCGTMVWDGDLVFASGGYPKSETVCVNAKSGKVVWRNNQKCYEQSMLAHQGYVYAVADSGVAYCWRAADGKVMWKKRMSRPISASPVLVGDTIMLSVESGRTFVFKANPNKFEEVATNQLGDEAFATPTVCGSRIYLRVAKREQGNRQEYLYCVGKK